MRYYASSNKPIAISYGKQAINLYQEFRLRINTHPPNVSDETKQADSLLEKKIVKALSPYYRELSNLLVSEGRLLEAQAVLDLLKDEEYEQLARSTEKAETVPYSQAETEAIAKIENLVSLERERTELYKIQKETGTLSAAQEATLEQLRLDIAKANTAFDNALAALGKAEQSAQIRVDEIKGGQELQGALSTLAKKTKSGVVALYTVLGTEEEKDAQGKPVKDKTKTKFGWVIMVREGSYTAYPINVENLEETVFQFRNALSSDKYDPQTLAAKIYTAIFRQPSKQKRTLEQDLQDYFKSSKDKTIMWSLDARGTEVLNLGDDENKVVSRTLYAIVGGVSDYNGTQLDLNFAAKDAEDFANALGIAARGLFCPKENPKCDRVKITLLTTPPKGDVKEAKELPTKANFRQAFADVAKVAKHEDVLVVYLAGHGTSLNVGDAETYFFLTQESEVGSKDAVGKNPERAISNHEILDWLTQEKWTAGQKGIRAENKVLILDTCAAGAFENVLTKDKQRDLSADQIKALEKLKDRTGLQILMGSAANQSAYEASQYGQGLLTYALLEGIRSAAWNEKNIIETGALFKHAVESVPKMDIGKGSSGLQAPRTFGATSIPVGLMTVKGRDAIKILESPLPVFGKPFIFQKDENFDTLGLIGALAKKLDAAGEAQTRGGENAKTASLVYIDDDNYPGAFRVTGTYAAEENGAITIEAVLRKDGKVFASLDKITGKDADEAAEKLFAAILKKLTEK